MTHAPLVLSFDTSTSQCSVALMRGPNLLGHHNSEMARGQTENLLVICQDMMAAAGQDVSALEAVGVGIGPGNFTGIRISVSAARGLALGLGVPAVGVSSFEALRYGTQGPCACAIDARRDQVFLQIFDAQGTASDPTLEAMAALPAFDGPLIGHGGARPQMPFAQAICHVAAARFRSNPEHPAPLYIKPADAAPARDAAPRILT